MIFLKPNNFLELFLQLIANLFFRLRISLRKKFNINQKNLNYLSGDFFQSIAKYHNSKLVYCSLKNFPQKKEFIKNKRKIWIFHNSDEVFDLEKKKRLDYFKPIKCFSQNLIINKKNYYFLPIGLENNRYQNYGDIRDFDKLRKINHKKKPRILYGFNITNKNRIKIKKNLEKLSICDETKGWNSFFYRRILKNYMFVICPPGNGIDTHRFWEALYLKTIPIIEKNEISRFLKKAGFPILLLDKWTDLSKFNEEKLKKFYISKKKDFSCKYLFQNYWKKKILK